jgi:hypothetical protein
LDGSAVKALVPLEGTENAVLSEVQKLREMLGGSKHLDDIEGAPEAELTVDAELPVHAAEESEPSVLVSAPPSPWGTAHLTRLSFTSLLAVYTFISVAAVLYAFYLIRGFLPRDQGQVKEASFADVSGYADEKSSITQEKTPAIVTAAVTESPIGVLVDIDTDVSVAGDEFHDAIDSDSRTSTPRDIPSDLLPVVEKPWLVPLPPSPSSSPLRRTVQLHEDPPIGGALPAWAMMVPAEQPRTGARTGNAAAAVDFALAMQLRTGVGMTADAAWLMRFVMALFGWVAVLVGERQAAGGRRLLGW